MEDRVLIQQLFKTEYRKIVSVLCKLFGIKHIEIAEDITNDTFLLASETWDIKGIPENPTAWLYTVAKNKTKDYFKRNKVFTDKITPELLRKDNEYEEIELTEENIKDSQLKMIFAVCNSSISKEAQIGLALKILCGFSIEEISQAFLSNKNTINKRLLRAKEKLRKENITFDLPNETAIDKRLDTVLTTLYLLFNEGYHSTTQASSVRQELCFEAMRLNYLLLENDYTNKPQVNALMSLMCFHASRFDARTNKSGGQILYQDQDRNLWDEQLIEKGNQYLIESAKGDNISKYHLEASIAYCHSTKIENKNKWETILQLYNRLLQIEYSPITALNRTYVLYKTKGKLYAIEEAKKLALTENHFYHSLLGYLYIDNDNIKAISHYKTAFNLAKSISDKRIIEKQLELLTVNKPK